MGMRAMVLHVIGDALGNVGVIITALIIWLTDWPGKYYADPAVSLFITLIILRSTIPLTVATAKILLQATPDHLIVEDIKADLEDIPGIVSCHHVHIWQLSDTQIVASMHIRVAFPITEEGGTERYMEVTRQAKKCLHAYGIHSATIQPEFQVGDFKGGLDGVDEEGDDERGLAKDRARAGSNACLLGCVDDCENEGCCVGPSGVEGEDDHDHGDEEHGRHH
jgi:zinc transporter 1